LEYKVPQKLHNLYLRTIEASLKKLWNGSLRTTHALLSSIPTIKPRFNIPQIIYTKVFACLFLSLVCAGGQSTGKSNLNIASITNISQLLQLDRGNNSLGLPVQMKICVTYADLQWNILFIHDESSGFCISHPGIANEPVAGDCFELSGVTTKGEFSTLISQISLRPLGKHDFPPPIPIEEKDLLSDAISSRWVSLVCVVRDISRQDERLKVEFLKGQHRLISYVRRGPDPQTDVDAWVGAQVNVRGVYANRYKNNQIASAGLFIPDLTHLAIIKPPPVMDLENYPITPIRNVLQEKIFGEKATRIRIQGAVIGTQGSRFTLADASGNIIVHSYSNRIRSLNDKFDVWAYPALENNRIILEDAVYRPIPKQNETDDIVSAPDFPPNIILTNVQSIRDLSPSEAAKKYPVRLVGVATHVDSGWHSFFLQDDSGALYVQGWLDGLELGDKVSVSGITEPGGAARMVIGSDILKLGHDKLPSPYKIGLKDLMNERYECAFVELDGVVCSVDDDPARAILRLANPEGRFTAMVQGIGEGQSLRRLVNSHVQVRGVCTLQMNNRNQIEGVQVRIAKFDNITTLLPSPSDVFSLVPTPIGAASSTDLILLGLQQIRLRGRVTLVNSKQTFTLQDATGAILVHARNANSFQVGDALDVIGFLDSNGSSVSIEQADFRQDPNPEPVSPKKIVGANFLLKEIKDREWVELEGRLIYDAGGSILTPLTVELGSTVITARFVSNQRAGRIPYWRANSILRLSGVVSLSFDDRSAVQSFILQLRSPSDIVLINAPPRWKPHHYGILFSGIGVVVLAGLAWVYLLRRRVREQTEQIRSRFEAEAALEKRLALVWENSAEGMRITDGQGLVIKVNEAYCRMVGKSRVELENQPFTISYKEDQRGHILESYQKMFLSRQISPLRESHVTLWDGREAWFEYINALFEQPGFPPTILCQFRDVTARKRAEIDKENLQNQLIQAQKMESVGRLAGGVAHDFNNMLQVILGNLSMAIEQVTPDLPIYQDLVEIQKAAQRSAEITRQLLAFARKQTVRPRNIDLNDAISNTLKMLHRLIGENIHLSWIPGKYSGLVNIDPVQLDQILANLIVNARDALTQNGKITIETSNCTLDQEFANAHTECVPGNYVLLSVSDNGRGMSQETKNHLFEPFYTTKDVGQGTGLGLATVYGIVKQNNGFIDVYSEPGLGSVFKIFLPLVDGQHISESEMDDQRSLHGTETLLLVEDEESVLNLGMRILTKFGYTVLTALTPYEALVLVGQYPDPIHLLITDVVMPGINGRELERQIRALKPGIRSLYTSGYTADVIAHHGMVDDNIHFVQKPFASEILAKKVRSILDDN